MDVDNNMIGFDMKILRFVKNFFFFLFSSARLVTIDTIDGYWNFGKILERIRSLKYIGGVRILENFEIRVML